MCTHPSPQGLIGLRSLALSESRVIHGQGSPHDAADGPIREIMVLTGSVCEIVWGCHEDALCCSGVPVRELWVTLGLRVRNGS